MCGVYIYMFQYVRARVRVRARVCMCVCVRFEMFSPSRALQTPAFFRAANVRATAMT